ncbi:MAG: hypothetical protein JW818_05685 [Pirellulales bacterium]|nr:hypothetical protein [Pirellulales bacterium]
MKDAIYTGLISGALFGAAWAVLCLPGFVVLAVIGYPAFAAAGTVLVFLVAGAPFGLCMGLLEAYHAQRFLGMKSVPESETLIHQGSSTHRIGFESVGGWLCLTNRALYFKSHELNFQPHELAIPLCEINRVEPRAILGILPTGLMLTLRDGRTERFGVHGRQQWDERIRSAKAIGTPRS